jgi:hypothetical protein
MASGSPPKSATSSGSPITSWLFSSLSGCRWQRVVNASGSSLWMTRDGGFARQPVQTAQGGGDGASEGSQVATRNQARAPDDVGAPTLSRQSGVALPEGWGYARFL